MQLYQFDYTREKIGKRLPENNLIDILTGSEMSRIVIDIQGFLGLNSNFGINYGS